MNKGTFIKKIKNFKFKPNSVLQRYTLTNGCVDKAIMVTITFTHTKTPTIEVISVLANFFQWHKHESNK